MNCRIRNTAWALARVGTMSPQYVSTPPSFAIIANVGIIVTWYGTITIDRNDQNIVSRPGKRFLAKAYPASEASSSTPTTETTE